MAICKIEIFFASRLGIYKPVLYILLMLLTHPFYSASYRDSPARYLVKSTDWPHGLNSFVVENINWRKLHNEELHNLYSSPNIIRQKKSRIMNWAGHVARMGEERKLYRVLVGKVRGKETTRKTEA
jgi:hypothetical protein